MKSPVPERDVSLRRRAEAQLALGDLPTKLALRDPIRMLHELQVHQIELEMQNEQLSSATRESDALRVKFQTLYELAPIAYMTLSVTGRILEFNARAMALLGAVDASQLVNHSLLSYVRDDRLEKLSQLLHAALEQGSASTDDLALLGVHPLPVYVQVQVHALTLADEDRPVLLVAMMDVTALRQIKDDVAVMLTREDLRIRPDHPGVPDSLAEMEWTVRFLRRLDQLVPHLAPVDAAAFAVGAFVGAAGREPETAAEQVAVDRETSDGGAWRDD